MLENVTLNADHEIEVTVSVTSAVKIICSCICRSIVKKCFISLNAIIMCCFFYFHNLNTNVPFMFQSNL